MAQVVAVTDASLHVYAGDERSATRTVVLHAGDSVDADTVADYILKDVKAGKASSLKFVADDSEAASLGAEVAARYDGEASVDFDIPEKQDVVQTVKVGDEVQQVETSLGVTPEGDSVFGSTGIKIEKGLSGPVDEV